MRRTLMVMAVATSGVVGSAATARADEWSLHLTGLAIASWSDNIESRAEADAEADFYYQLRPGALFSYATIRTVHEVTYNLEANLYQERRGDWSLAHHTGWRGFFLTGPRSELNSSLTISGGNISTLDTAQASNNTGPRVPRAATVTDFFTTNLEETFHYSITRPLRLTQGFRAQRTETKDPAQTVTTGTEVGPSVGLDRAWEANSLGATIGASFVRLENQVLPLGSGMVARDNSMIANAIASWRRDLSLSWSTLLDGGATAVIPIEEGENFVVQPNAGAQISYAPGRGNASLSARRSIAPDLYIAQHTVTDSALLTVGLALPWLTPDPMQPRLSVAASGGATRTSILDLDSGDTVQGYRIYSGDVALSYAPTNGLAIGLRYQYIRQDADDPVAGMMTTANELIDYERQTVQLTIGGRWPDRLAAEVPSRNSLRVDRSDVTVVGEETTNAGTGSVDGGRMR